MILVKAGETDSRKLRAYFYLVNNEGVFVPDEVGQPQISINGTAWTNVGIGALNEIGGTGNGKGEYFADLDISAVTNSGDRIVTRYESNNTVESRGSEFTVVGYDPYAVSTIAVADIWSASSRTLTSAVIAPTSFTQETVYGDPLCLIQESAKTLTISIPDVANGRSITKAYFKVATDWNGADNTALLLKTITTSLSGEGQITAANLDGTASITFQIGDGDLASITPDQYYSSVKIILDNGAAITPPQGLRVCTVYPAGVQAVS